MVRVVLCMALEAMMAFVVVVVIVVIVDSWLLRFLSCFDDLIFVVEIFVDFDVADELCKIFPGCVGYQRDKDTTSKIYRQQVMEK